MLYKVLIVGLMDVYDLSPCATSFYFFAGSNSDNSANEFFLGFTLSSNGSNVLLQLLVTTPESRFTVSTTGFSYSGVATQNSLTNVRLSSSLHAGESFQGEK